MTTFEEAIKDFDISDEWIKGLLEKEIGSNDAYLITKHYKNFCKNLILSDKVDEKMAYKIAMNYNKIREWAENIIEKERDLDSASLMVKNCNSSPFWQKEIG